MGHALVKPRREERLLAQAHDRADAGVVPLAEVQQLTAIGKHVGRAALAAGAGGAGDVDAPRGGDGRELGEPLQNGVCRGVVHLQHGVGHAAALGAIGLHEGDVHAVVRHAGDDAGQRSGHVSVGDKDRLVLAQDVHGDAVDAAAAQALAADLERATVGLRDGDVDGVGVQGRVVPADGKAVGQAALVGNLERVANALVVGVKAQDAAEKCAVGAVAAVGVGEAVPQREGDGGGLAGAQREGRLGAAQGAGRVRARGADHDGAKDLEGGHLRHGFLPLKAAPGAAAVHGCRTPLYQRG